ncbi:hypothetical protein ACFQUX_01350 [Pantoea stewartii]
MSNSDSDALPLQTCASEDAQQQRAIIDVAPGKPGIEARWTSSAKSGIGTALSPDSRVWFTLSHGILNEIYYPRVDSACTRDFGFIITAPEGYFSEEKRDCSTETHTVSPGIPAFSIVNTARDGRYRLEKDIITDPARDCVLQRIRFTALKGMLRITRSPPCSLPIW